MIHTDNAHANFIANLCQPGGAAIIFSEKLEFFAKVFWANPFLEKNYFNGILEPLLNPKHAKTDRKYELETFQFSNENLEMD